MTPNPDHPNTDRESHGAPPAFEAIENREQLTATRDLALHDWHAGWIDDVMSADGEG